MNNGQFIPNHVKWGLGGSAMLRVEKKGDKTVINLRRKIFRFQLLK